MVLHLPDLAHGLAFASLHQQVGRVIRHRSSHARASTHAHFTSFQGASRRNPGTDQVCGPAKQRGSIMPSTQPESLAELGRAVSGSPPEELA